MSFPQAHYLIASSRLHAGVDGGYAVSVMRRAQQFRDIGGVTPHLLTFDFAPDYDVHRRGFRELGLANERTVLRNLMEEARRDPSWLLAAARSEPGATPASGVDYVDHVDDAGDVLLRTPFVRQPDWHRTEAPIVVVRDGTALGVFDGFGGLYRAWLRHVLSQFDDELPVVVIAESRQIGELIRSLRDDRVRMVHTVHSAQTLPPHTWDSEVDALWGGWLDTLDDYDALVFLTRAQRDDVLRRWPTLTHTEVIPHGIEGVPRADSPHDPNRIAIITRLTPNKRIDHAVRAVAMIVERGTLAHLDVYGDGPERVRLQALIDELGMSGHVTLHGYVPDASARIANAAVLALTSTYEGLPLVLAEAFRRGVPVVAYDVNYGPADVIDGTNGVLVEAGDVDALADSLESVLADAELRERLSEGAHATAEGVAPAAVMRQWAALFSAVVDPALA